VSPTGNSTTGPAAATSTHGGDPGYGHPRTWPPGELAVAERMARAVRAGLTPYAAHRAARGTTDLGHGVTITITPRTENHS
jgi:hypothetical protein